MCARGIGQLPAEEMEILRRPAGFRFHGLGFGLGFRVLGLGIRVLGLGFRVWGFGFRV